MTNAVPTVFVVDDDSAVLSSLSRLLRSCHLMVATFDSPQEFLERHDPCAPGCVVLDVTMPGLDGLKLQQALTAKGNAVPYRALHGRGRRRAVPADQGGEGVGA